MAKKLPKAPKPVNLTKVLAPYFKQVGGVIYVHGMLDRTLEWLMVVLTQSYHTPTIMNQIGTWEARIDLFSQMARIRFRDKKTISRIKGLVDELKAVNSHRNNLVHGRWLGFQAGWGAQIQRLRPRGELPGNFKLVRYKPQDIRTVAKRMWALNKRLMTFHVYAQAANTKLAKRQSRPEK